MAVEKIRDKVHKLAPKCVLMLYMAKITVQGIFYFEFIDVTTIIVVKSMSSHPFSRTQFSSVKGSFQGKKGMKNTLVQRITGVRH